MLPRKLISEHFSIVVEGLLLRGPMSDDLYQALEKVRDLSQESILVGKQIDELRNQRNLLSKSFGSIAKDQQLKVRLEVLSLKTKIEELETRYSTIETECHHQESTIPNIPSPDVPLPSRYTGDLLTHKQTVLRLLSYYIEEYNNHWENSWG